MNEPDSESSKTPNDSHGFHADYFETCFELEGKMEDLPSSYSIITAYATTGEKWTDEENREADVRLATELDKVGASKWRITGYSPSSGHAEPGWAIELPHEKANALGKNYRQHAIYFVEKGALNVMLCEDSILAKVGVMTERLHDSDTPRIHERPPEWQQGK